jgi:hypothetical protein
MSDPGHCRDCRFWKPYIEEGEPLHLLVGECRKGSPTLTEAGWAIWPDEVAPDDWCGDFELSRPGHPNHEALTAWYEAQKPPDPPDILQTLCLLPKEDTDVYAPQN